MSEGLFLPETAGVNLPDNLESMKTFGKYGLELSQIHVNPCLIFRNDRFFWMPLLGSDAREVKPKTSTKKEIGAEDNLAFSSI